MTEAETGFRPVGTFNVSLAAVTKMDEIQSPSGRSNAGRAIDTLACQSARRQRSWRIFEKLTLPGGVITVWSDILDVSIVVISIEWP